MGRTGAQFPRVQRPLISIPAAIGPCALRGRSEPSGESAPVRITETQFVQLLADKARRHASRLRHPSGRHADALAQAGLRTGIGDDCAVIAQSSGNDLLVTTDLFLEDVHFRHEWQAARSIGHKVLARGLSDIAAMGGIPRYAFLSLGLPSRLSIDWVDDFLSGFFKLAQAAGVVLAGGDTGRSHSGFVADIIVVGDVVRGEAVLRSGARPGDEIWVTGLLGRAADGLAGLEAWGARARRLKSCAEAVRKFLYPEPRLRAGRFLRERKLASAMIDLSDGLSIDLARLCQRSGVGARVFEDSIPRPPETAPDHFLHGGEDLELLFTVPSDRSHQLPARFAGVKLTRIGEIVSGKKGAGKKPRPNLLLVRNGKESDLPVLGFQHF